MNLFQRWRLKRQSKWLADVCGFTPDELVLALRLKTLLDDYRDGKLEPAQVEELAALTARRHVKPVLAKMQAAGVLVPGLCG
jgi:hypothetical protein